MVDRRLGERRVRRSVRRWGGSPAAEPAASRAHDDTGQERDRLGHKSDGGPSSRGETAIRTYSALFAGREFRALFTSTALAVAASTVSGLALATLLYARTGSPLLSALGLFGPSFGQFISATLLMSAADRVPPRAALVTQGVLLSAATLLVAVPGLPVPVILAVGLVVGTITALGSAVRWGLLTEVLPPGGYVLGRSAMNISVGVVQIAGFASGAVLLHAIAPMTLLLASAVLYALSGMTLLVGLASRIPRGQGRPSVGATMRVNRALLADRRVRSLLLATWLPNGLVVGVESLFVPYAGRDAGALFVGGAAGMLFGDALVGRLAGPGLRSRLAGPLRFLLAVPYLLFVLRPGVGPATMLALVASVGFGATLIQQERLVGLSPLGGQGQLLGLQQAGMLGMQAVGATLAGSFAGLASVPVAMTVLAVLSLIVSAALTPGLRSAAAHGPSRS